MDGSPDGLNNQRPSFQATRSTSCLKTRGISLWLGECDIAASYPQSGLRRLSGASAAEHRWCLHCPALLQNIQLRGVFGAMLLFVYVNLLPLATLFSRARWAGWKAISETDGQAGLQAAFLYAAFRDTKILRSAMTPSILGRPTGMTKPALQPNGLINAGKTLSRLSLKAKLVRKKIREWISPHSARSAQEKNFCCVVWLDFTNL